MTKKFIGFLFIVGVVSLLVIPATASAAVYFPTTVYFTPYNPSTEAKFTGAPDDLGTNLQGLDGMQVIYDFTGGNAIQNVVGGDINLYELDWGTVQFDYISVYVSNDMNTWYNITATRAAGVDIVGDEAHGGGQYFQSYDLNGVLAFAKYLKLVGSSISGFDLDAVAAVNSVPVPGAVWLLGSGLIGLMGLRRRKA